MSTTKPGAKGKVQPAPQWTGKATPRGGAGAGRGKPGNAPSPTKPVVQEDRDPKGINKHVKVQFYDVIAEVGPESNGARSHECVWRNSHACYSCWKNCLYRLQSLFCGVCLACAYAFEISLVFFPVIWFLTPCSEFIRTCFCSVCSRCVGMCADFWIGTVCESCGEIFWPFRGYKKDSLLPTQQGGGGGKGVTFNKSIKFRTIPANKNAPAGKPGTRPTARVAPAAGNKPQGKR